MRRVEQTPDVLASNAEQTVPLTSDSGLENMQTAAHTSWHEVPVSEVAGLLETDLVSGLSADEAESRLKEYGPNKVTEKAGTPLWKRFLLQFHQPLIYILLVASGLTLGLGEFVDGSVIFGVVFILGLIGYIQETKAEDAIRALTKMLVAEATVRRDRRKQRFHPLHYSGRCCVTSIGRSRAG